MRRVFHSLAGVQGAGGIICSDEQLLCPLAPVAFGLDPNGFRRGLDPDFADVVSADLVERDPQDEAKALV